jgi:prephenate dehydrogenase
MYSQILSNNPEPLIELLTDARRELAHAIDALRGGDIGTIQRILSAGNDGVSRIPAKHGGPARALAELWITVQDRQGELARLFADAAELSVNIEDVRIDHEPERPVGSVHIWVEESAADAVVDALNGRGWPAHR